MSLYAYLRVNPKATKEEIEDCLDGNLCRCTGYRPILDAAKTVLFLFFQLYLAIKFFFNFKKIVRSRGARRKTRNSIHRSRNYRTRGRITKTNTSRYLSIHRTALRLQIPKNRRFV